MLRGNHSFSIKTRKTYKLFHPIPTLKGKASVVRLFIVEAVSCFETGELLSGIGKVLEDVLELLVETASRWIRADRDGHRPFYSSEVCITRELLEKGDTGERAGKRELYTLKR
jgi:hypothetical protein